MHAQRIVDRFVNERLALHAARRPSWGAAIWAAMRGRVLSLSSLARAIAGGGTVKSALKRMERLIGGARVESEAQEVAAALLGGWRCLGVPLAIAVDWSALDPGSRHVEWRAAVTWLGMGRGLTVYSRVCPLRQLGSAKVERALLAALRGWIAADVQVVIVTDAGFRRPWFAQVEALGWGWIGRVRAGVKLGGPAVDGQRQWGSAQQWFAQATGCAQRHSDCALTRRYAWGCDLVLWHGPRRERTEYRRAGRGGTAKARGAAQCGRTLGAGAFAPPAASAPRRNRGDVRAAHADRGALSRHQVDRAGHGAGAQSLALGAAAACAAADPHRRGVPAVAHWSMGRKRRTAAPRPTHQSQDPRTVGRPSGRPAVRS